VYRQARKINTSDAYRIQAHADAGRVEPDFSDDAGLGDLADGWFGGLFEVEEDEVGLLRLFPLLGLAGYEFRGRVSLRPSSAQAERCRRRSRQRQCSHLLQAP